MGCVPPVNGHFPSQSFYIMSLTLKFKTVTFSHCFVLQSDPRMQPLSSVHFSHIPGRAALTKPSVLDTLALVDGQQGSWSLDF